LSEGGKGHAVKGMVVLHLTRGKKRNRWLIFFAAAATANTKTIFSIKMKLFTATESGADLMNREALSVFTQKTKV
jgi:hypothetical protein